MFRTIISRASLIVCSLFVTNTIEKILIRVNWHFLVNWLRFVSYLMKILWYHQPATWVFECPTRAMWLGNVLATRLLIGHCNVTLLIKIPDWGEGMNFVMAQPKLSADAIQSKIWVCLTQPWLLPQECSQRLVKTKVQLLQLELIGYVEMDIILVDLNRQYRSFLQNFQQWKWPFRNATKLPVSNLDRHILGFNYFCTIAN